VARSYVSAPILRQPDCLFITPPFSPPESRLQCLALLSRPLYLHRTLDS
jgi:hypothetical protein